MGHVCAALDLAVRPLRAVSRDCCSARGLCACVCAWSPSLLDRRETRDPHVAIHLCIVFNVLFIYIDCPPRTNLVLDDAYNDHVYGTARNATGKSLNDLHVACVEDKKFKQYVSKSHVVNAFMVAPTTLLYTVPMNKKNFAKVRELSMDYMKSWLEMLDETEGVLVDGIDTRERQTELLQIDVRPRPALRTAASALGPRLAG